MTVNMKQKNHHLDKVAAYTDACDDSDIQPHYYYIRAIKELVTEKQHVTNTQLKLDTFFKPTTPSNPASPQPSISSTVYFRKQTIKPAKHSD
jgi:hypothetical protein